MGKYFVMVESKCDRGITPSSQKKKRIKLLRFCKRKFYTYYEKRTRLPILCNSELDTQTKIIHLIKAIQK
jgi:hypothetical protein